MHEAAQELFAWDDQGDGSSHCYVKQQPRDWNELTNMLDAMLDSEMDCVRYRGDDSLSLRRVVEAGLTGQIDVPTPHEHTLVVRNYVSFHSSGPSSFSTISEVALGFRHYLAGIDSKLAEYQSSLVRPDAIRQPSDVQRYSFTPLIHGTNTVSFKYSPGGQRFHKIEMGALGSSAFSMHHFSVDAEGFRVSRQIKSWLAELVQVTDILWYTAEEWKSSKSGQPTPY